MRTLFAAACLLAAAATLPAAPPDAPPVVSAKAVGKPVLFEIKYDKGKSFGWAAGFDKSKCVVVRLQHDDPTVAAFMAIPDEAGDFYLTFWTVGEKASSQTIIRAGGTKPPVPVDPVDPPKPDPEKKAAKVIIVIVEETMRRATQDAATLYDKGLREWAKAGGHEIELIDKDDPAAAASGYLPYVDKTGLPSVIVFDAAKTGTQIPLSAFKLPATGAALKAEVQKVVK